jgi:hypothetical protein
MAPQPRFEELSIGFGDEVILRLHKEFAKGIVELFLPRQGSRHFQLSAKIARDFQNLPDSPWLKRSLSGKNFRTVRKLMN